MPRMPSVLPDSQVEPEELTHIRARLLPPYKVILLNDDYNTMDYVVDVLLSLIDHLTAPEATEIMWIAHLTGSAVVVVCPKERAEYYQERLLGAGLIARIEPD